MLPTTPLLTLLTLLTTLLSLTNASFLPTSLPIHRRGVPGSFYICTGTCTWHSPNNSMCYTSALNPAQSLGPDEAGSCVLYENDNCSGAVIQTVRFPGLADGVPKYGGVRCEEDLKVVPVPY